MSSNSESPQLRIELEDLVQEKHPLIMEAVERQLAEREKKGRGIEYKNKFQFFLFVLLLIQLGKMGYDHVMIEEDKRVVEAVEQRNTLEEIELKEPSIFKRLRVAVKEQLDFLIQSNTHSEMVISNPENGERIRILIDPETKKYIIITSWGDELGGVSFEMSSESSRELMSEAIAQNPALLYLLNTIFDEWNLSAYMEEGEYVTLHQTVQDGKYITVFHGVGVQEDPKLGRSEKFRFLFHQSNFFELVSGKILFSGKSELTDEGNFPTWLRVPVEQLMPFDYTEPIITGGVVNSAVIERLRALIRSPKEVPNYQMLAHLVRYAGGKYIGLTEQQLNTISTDNLFALLALLAVNGFGYMTSRQKRSSSSLELTNRVPLTTGRSVATTDTRKRRQTGKRRAGKDRKNQMDQRARDEILIQESNPSQPKPDTSENANENFVSSADLPRVEPVIVEDLTRDQLFLHQQATDVEQNDRH